MPRLLLIDDDQALGEPLASYVARFGMQLAQAVRPSEGLALLRAGGFDAAILDVMLPEMDGFALCRIIRQESDIPIVMLTARGDVMDRVVGLELGADDYLPKPFEPRELVARLQTVLRRRVAAAAPDGRLRFEGLTIDPVTRSVHRGIQDMEAVELTSTEFDLLLLLAREPGKVVAKNVLAQRLEPLGDALDAATLEVHVSNLRKKIGAERVVTVRGVGYRLQP